MTETTPVVPSEVAETIREAISMWIVDAAVGHHDRHEPIGTLEERTRRSDAALAWLEGMGNDGE